MLNNEWMWVVLIGVVLFGAGNLPKLAKGMGEGIREFKKAISGLEPETEPKTAPKTPSDAKEN